jgi:hypothetical protein
VIWVLRHDLLDGVDGGLGVETGVVQGRAEGLAEGGEGLFVGPDIDDGKAGVGAVADVVKAVRLVDDGLSCVEDLAVFLHGFRGELEDGGDCHGFSFVRWVNPLT